MGAVRRPVADGAQERRDSDPGRDAPATWTICQQLRKRETKAFLVIFLKLDKNFSQIHRELT